MQRGVKLPRGKPGSADQVSRRLPSLYNRSFAARRTRQGPFLLAFFVSQAPSDILLRGELTVPFWP